MEPPAQQSAVPPVPVPPSKGGCACCAMGCTSIFVIALVALALLLGGTWWLGEKLLDNYTSSESIAVQVPTPTEAEVSAATAKLSTLQQAMRDRQSITVELTAADVNTLIARAPEFEQMRGKFRVAMADSIMTLDMSVPLSSIEIPKIRHRWLNGTARFGFLFSEDAFVFNLRSLNVNGRDLSLKFLHSLDSSFNSSFNQGFEKSLRENERSREFWGNVKAMEVTADKLVITTKGADSTAPAPADDEASDEAEITPTPPTL
ncbi:MAG: hypothetical protein ABI992_02565 [Chthoniobacterales bacterium]